MNNFEKKFKSAKYIKLSDDERSYMRAKLMAHMKLHNFPVKIAHTWSEKWMIFFSAHKAISAALIIILFIGSGSGVALGAERALPGDVLYPVKVNINEEVLGLLKLSPKTKATWEATRATKRLEEIEHLTANNIKITAETHTALIQQFKKHKEKAEAIIVEIEKQDDARDAIKIRSDFEVGLFVHEKILEELADDRGKRKKEIAPIAISVKNAARVARQEREINEQLMENDNNEKVASAAGMGRVQAENAILDVKKTVAETDLLFEKDTLLKINAELAKATDIITNGNEQFARGNYGKSLTLFNKAGRIAEKSRLLIRVKDKLRIDIKIEDDEREDDDEDAEKEMFDRGKEAVELKLENKKATEELKLKQEKDDHKDDNFEHRKSKKGKRRN